MKPSPITGNLEGRTAQFTMSTFLVNNSPHRPDVVRMGNLQSRAIHWESGVLGGMKQSHLQPLTNQMDTLGTWGSGWGE